MKTDQTKKCSKDAARHVLVGAVENNFLKRKKKYTLSKSEWLFHKKVNYSNDCWIWNGCKSHEGYGKLTRRIDGKLRSYLAHRFLFRNLNTGSMFACHSCDNPSCVRPSHIFFGTPRDNVRDCISKGRFNFEETTKAIIEYSTGRDRSGTKNGKAKLTNEQVMEIRSTTRTRYSCRMFANKFNVSHVTIRKISNGIGYIKGGGRK